MGNNKIKVIADKEELVEIANALREKTGNGKSMGLGVIANTIRGWADGGIDISDATLESGSQMLEGVTAYGANGKITGTIPSVSGATITPNDESQTVINQGSYVTGDVIVSAVPTEATNITTNGTYTPTNGKYFSSVNVNIPEKTFETQTKSVDPSESQQTVSPDNGYDGLSSVTINAIASDYVGTAVPRENAKTIIPTKASQVAVSSGTYVNGDITVGAIPSEYITTNDADAIAEEIALNKIAYVDGKKVVGSFTIENEVSNQEEIISTQDEMIANIVSALEGKAAGGGSGGSIETCTVYVDNNLSGTMARGDLIYCFSILDGNTINKVETEQIAFMDGTTISNVICGSIGVVNISQAQNESVLSISDGDTEEKLSSIRKYDSDYHYFQIPYGRNNLWITVGL